ncbi:DUF1592 domain-containing protein [Stieleria sp. ICT_E10.1]|uniref:DUF1592 domain-containing protein n=1 Tax=Stieleria sedimenti TaxID=2976331 RepID=UPI00217F9516|nr:DUF1592 domain-containing protein [Stieleria sedimenti]MCS7469584.1 DUF1592 domain-containing protein [Stieleria sedimenti]
MKLPFILSRYTNSDWNLGGVLPLPVLILVSAMTPDAIALGQEAVEESVERDLVTEVVQPFLAAHCVRCHGPKQANAGFRIDQIPTDFTAAKAAEQWKEVVDMINLGEMPPKEEARPRPDEFEPVVDWIHRGLRDAERLAHSAGGRIPMRRLNRVEFANTVRDLLHMDPKVLAPLVEELPGDGKAEGFDRLGVALFFDQTQIQRTLEVAERIAERAIVVGDPEVQTERAEAENNPRVKPSKRQMTSRFANTVVAPGPSGFETTDGGVRFVHGYGNRPKGDRWGRLGNLDASDVVLQDGYYRIRVRAGASPGSRGEPIRVRAIYGSKTPVHAEVEIPIPSRLDDPQVHEAMVFLRCGPDGLKRGIGFSFNDIDKLIVTTPENNHWMRAVREAQGQLRDANTSGAPKAEIEQARAELDAIVAEASKWKGPLRHFNPEHDSENPPTIFVDWFEISGPVAQQWPPKSHQTLLFAGDEEANAGREDADYVREIFTRLLGRAYRRPVNRAEIDGVVEFVEQARQSGAEFYDAVRLGLARVLCSPGFLFIQEPADAPTPRKLNDYELASRLSYFLWSSMPDETLFELAERERLRDPQTLLEQVDRMLDDPKADAFVEGFAGQWLDVREFGNTVPAKEYSDYDAALEESSKLEAYAFFREVVADDLPVTNFLDSEFVMINQRLAQHYGIEGVEGPNIRRVAIEPQHHRGGVLGMAGLMTLLSDGTRTLPVRRAAWVKTELFGDPPGNPPPNAGEIQPNTAGKKLTVRERLDLHRNEPTCASCHAKLDPFGIALENYDVIGKWRTQANGEGFRGKNAPLIDVSGRFPEGDAFTSLQQYKAGLLERRDAFTRNLVAKMLTYALTRPVGYPDHQTVATISDSVRQNDYRMRTLIRKVVASELFQSK